MTGVWIEGVRISTLATLVVFALIGLARGGDMKGLWAGAAWLTGFAVAYQVTGVVMGTLLYPRAAIIFTLIGLVVVPIATTRTVRPWWPMAVLFAVLWVVWIAFGFHANGHETTDVFNLRDEIINESAKTAWALAYLVPLWRTRSAATRERPGRAAFER